MRDLIDSILIGECASYLPFWFWNSTGDQIAGALALIGVVYIAKRWHVWNVSLKRILRAATQKDPKNNNSLSPFHCMRVERKSQ